MSQKIENLVVDTTAFIQNASLQEIAENIFTVQEVVDEITNKRQLRRLIVLPYELQVKNVFPENVIAVTDFSKKTGDYPSLSATDIKVMALTLQMEKEKVGTAHLRTELLIPRQLIVSTAKKPTESMVPNMSGFYLPNKSRNDSEGSNSVQSSSSVEDSKDDAHGSTEEENTSVTLPCTEKIDKELSEKFATLNCDLNDTEGNKMVDGILKPVSYDSEEGTETDECSDEDDDDEGWITPGNLNRAKRQIGADLLDDTPSKVACITTDFAMQNVLKQMNLNVAALDGRMIKQLRTFIFRCHTCYKTTSLMEKVFCPKCGNKTLKKVAVSVDSEGKQKIHINGRRQLTGRGKKYSLPTPRGGKHSNNPILFEDQRIPQQRPTRQARMKNNPLDPDYIAGYSPFVTRDVNSRSALLGIRPGAEKKYWMKKNPNEATRKSKK